MRTAVSQTRERVSFLVSANTPTISIAALSLDITTPQSINGLKFFVPSIGNPQVYPASDASSYTADGASPGNRFTYAGLPFGATTMATPDPSLSTNKAAFQAGLSTINYASSLPSTFTTATSDIGSYVIGSAVVPTGVVVGFSGYIQSDLNDGSTRVPIFDISEPPIPEPPIVVSPASQSVVFGQVVSAGKSFTSTVTVFSLDSADVLTLFAGTLPVGVSNVFITPAAGGVSPQTFTVTGLLNASTIGSTVLIPITASDGQGGSSNGVITLVVTPEPGSVAAVVGAGMFGISRRRR